MPAFLAYLMVLGGVMGHASSEFFAVLSGVQGAEVSVWRYLIGAAGLAVVCLLWPATRDLWTPLRQEWRRLVPYSLIGISLAYLCFHWALDYASIVQVGTVVTTIPIFVGLVNLMANRAPIGVPKLISGAAAVTGVALLLTDGYLDRLAGGGESLIGILLAVGCASLASLYMVLARPIINHYGALRITAVSLLIGAAGLWVIVGTFWGVWVQPFSLPHKESVAIWSLLTLGLWNTTITQVLWFGGLAAVPDITRGSYLFFLKPVITAILALAILREPISPVQLLAILVICGAVLAELFWPLLPRLAGKK
ncbi:MAG: DMT family transporter [Methyloligellaceae bacterium]